MTTFETLDKQNFVTLSETEMMETEGGLLDPFSLGLLVGGGITLAATGYSIWKSSQK